MSSDRLTIVPQGWFSWDFSIMDERGTIAEIDVAWWREKGELTIQGVSYKVYREGLLSGAFILEAGGVTIARAEKPNFLLRSYAIEHEGKQYTLQAKSAFLREFVLLAGDREIGSIAPDGIFTRRATAVFSIDLPLPVKVFLIWLVIILWKRAADSANSS